MMIIKSYWDFLASSIKEKNIGLKTVKNLLTSRKSATFALSKGKRHKTLINTLKPWWCIG